MTYHVLVVDDDELVRTGLAANLERDGYRVSAAPSANEALALMSRAEVDLVLTDLVMEGMDGMALLRRVASQSPDLPVIVLTGHGSASNAIEAIREGAADYIQKPAKPEEIAHRIRGVLDTREMKRRLMKDRVRVQAQRRDLDQRVLRRDRLFSLGLLAAGVSAELRGLLGDLAAGAAVLRSMPGRAEAARDVERALEELRRLSERLAEIGPAPAGAVEPVDLNGIIGAYLESDAFAAVRDGHPQCVIETRLDAATPAARGVAAELAPALAAIVEMAVEMAGGNRRVRISTFMTRVPASKAGTAGHFAVARIRFGATARPEDLGRLFEPYYAAREMGWSAAGVFDLARLQAAAVRGGGFADAQIAADGPQLDIDVYLPVADPVQAEETPRLRSRANERILVVDDSEAHRNEARRLLEELGYEVCLSESGYAAAAWVEERARNGEPPVT